MAGRGMGAATQGGGCVGKGPRNKVESKPSRKVGDPVMMMGGDVKGGDVKKKMGGDVKKKMGGGMMYK
jgi:hypothetical protein